MSTGRPSATVASWFTWWRVVLLLGGTLCVSFASTLLAAARSDRCARKGSVTVTSNEQVRVYRDRPQVNHAQVIACHRATGSKTRLGSPIADTLHEFGGARAIALRGSTIAYSMIVDPQGDEGGPGTELVRLRMPFKSDRPAYATAPATRLTVSDSTSELAVERIFIASTGTVVLSACPARDFSQLYKGCGRPPGRVRIVAAPNSAFLGDERFRPPVVLAESMRIEPRSLRLSPAGGHVGWTQNSRRRSERLPTD